MLNRLLRRAGARIERRSGHPIGRRILGLTFDGRPIWEPAGAGSSLTFAAAGGGKTTCVTIPAIQTLLADRKRALLINDVKNGEVGAQIGSMCVKHQRRFGVLDDFTILGNRYPHRLSLNPLGAAVHAFCEATGELPFVLENIAHALIEEPKDDSKNTYWREAPRELIELCIRLLLDRHPRFCYPGALYALLANPKTWIAALHTALAGDDADLAAAAQRVLDMREHNPEHYEQHVRAALSALKIFSFGPLAEAGRNPDLTHADLIRDGWIICLVNPARYAERLGSYFAMHFLAFMQAQLSGNAGRAEYVLDEFCNAPLREALNRVTIQRAFQARTHFIAQSRQDCVRKYGERETALLEENCTVKVWLKFSNFEEAERVSKAIGESLSVSYSLGVSSEKNDFSNTYTTGRDRVLTADELMRLPDDEQILHIAGVGFIHCKKIRQSQIAPYCFDLSDNPLEGGRLPPDPRVFLGATSDQEDTE